MRLFVALFPPKEYLDYLRDVTRKFQKQKRNLKLVPTDQLHVTLKYIGGKVHENSFELIRDELASHAGSYGKVQLELTNLAFGFSFEKFPKILLHHVKTTDSLLEVSNSVHSYIQSLKLRDTIRRKNRYANSFHITLARLKENSTKSTAKLLSSNVKNISLPKPPAIEMDEMWLVESIMGKGTPQYKRLEKISL